MNEAPEQNRNGMNDKPAHQDRLLSEAIEFRQDMLRPKMSPEERSRARAAMEENERLFRLMFAWMPVALGVFDIERDRYGKPTALRLLTANTAFEKLTGVKREAMAGQDLRDVLPWLGAGDVDAFLTAAHQGNVARVGAHHAAADEHYEIAGYCPQRDEFALVLADVTEHCKTRQAIEQEHARHRGILEDQTELICRSRSDGSLTFTNRAYSECFGEGDQALSGHAFLPGVSNADREIILHRMESLSVERPFVTYEHRVVVPDGETRWIEWTDRAVFDGQGAVVEIQSVGRDVTGRHQADPEPGAYRKDVEELLKRRDGEIEDAQRQVREAESARREAEKKAAELEKRLAKAQAKALGHEMRLCDFCKRVCDDRGRWIPLEIYLRDQTEASVLSGVCPYCNRKARPAASGSKL